MYCQSEEHAEAHTPESVAWIRMIALLDQPGYHGFEVCTKHLIDYVQGVFLDQDDHELRAAFTVEPTP